MLRAHTPRILFFLVIALLMLAELWFSNWGTLANNLEETATLLGLSVAAERTRLWILIVLDAISGGGALLATLGYLGNQPTLQRTGVLMTAIGLVLYGGYQLTAALVQLAPAMTIPVASVGVVYIVIGVIAYTIGTRPLQVKS